MSDMTIRGPGCDDEGERGERGERGRRGETGSTGPTGPTGPTVDSRLIAAANVSGDGVELAGFGFSSITHPSAGTYLLTLTNPPADDAVIPTALMKTTSALIKALPVVGGVITIIIQQVDFVAIDQDFFIHVVDGT